VVVSIDKRRARRPLGRALGAAIALAGIGLIPFRADAAGPQLQPFGLPQPRPPFPFAANGSSVSPGALSAPDFDPASSSLFSLLSSQAMRNLAPNAFGDFISATGRPGPVLSSAFGSSSQSAVPPMPALDGVDPDVAAMLSSSVSSIANGSGASGAAGTSAGMSGAGIVSSSAGINATGAVVGSSGGSVIGPPGTLSETTAAVGIAPVCGANQVSSRLQAGGEYWTGQAVSATPVQFPPGVFAGMHGGDPLGDLGPTGNPTNVASQGQAGAWCIPGQTSFYESSPLESRVAWIVFVIVTGGIVIFLLSRGVHRPARSLEGSSLLGYRNEAWRG
jgi:hypothetical protein